MHARAVVLMSVGDAACADATTLRILIALRVAGLKKDAYVVAEVNALTAHTCKHGETRGAHEGRVA